MDEVKKVVLSFAFFTNNVYQKSQEMNQQSSQTHEELCQDNHGKVKQRKTPRPSVEQILIEKGHDPAKYRVSDAEFDAATGKAHFPPSDWE